MTSEKTMNKQTQSKNSNSTDPTELRDVIDAVLRVMNGTGYGSVHVTIKNKEVVEVAFTETTRPKLKA